MTETVSRRGGELPPPTPERVWPDLETPSPGAGNPPAALAFVGAGRAAGAKKSGDLLLDGEALC